MHGGVLAESRERVLRRPLEREPVHRRPSYALRTVLAALSSTWCECSFPRTRVIGPRLLHPGPPTIVLQSRAIVTQHSKRLPSILRLAEIGRLGQPEHSLPAPLSA